MSCRPTTGCLRSQRGLSSRLRSALMLPCPSRRRRWRSGSTRLADCGRRECPIPWQCRHPSLPRCVLIHPPDDRPGRCFRSSHQCHRPTLDRQISRLNDPVYRTKSRRWVACAGSSSNSIGTWVRLRVRSTARVPARSAIIDPSNTPPLHTLSGIVKTFGVCSDAAMSQPSTRPTLYKGYRPDVRAVVADRGGLASDRRPAGDLPAPDHAGGSGGPFTARSPGPVIDSAAWPRRRKQLARRNQRARKRVRSAARPHEGRRCPGRASVRARNRLSGPRGDLRWSHLSTLQPPEATRSRRAFSWAVGRYPRIVECGGGRFRERGRACGGRPELRGGCGGRRRRRRCQSGRGSHQAGPRGRCASRISRERSRPAESQEPVTAQHSGETDCNLRHAGQSGTSRCPREASSETSSSRANR